MSTGPAVLTGLSDRGAICPGKRADLCVVALDETFEVCPARLQHRNSISPYTGCTLRGVVHQTWLRGTRISADRRDGKLVHAGLRASRAGDG
jgi:allantoinase